MSTCEIGGRAYPILAGIRSEIVGGFVPLVDLPLMSDYRWQVKALEHRLAHAKQANEHERKVQQQDGGGQKRRAADKVA